MSFVKYANAEILEVKTSKTRIPFEHGSQPGSMFQKFASLEDTGESDGYMYIRTRAISSRVNKNNDGWPSEELGKSYATFRGRPTFVDHHNDDPKRTRGVILDARLFVDEGEKTSAFDPYYSSAPAAHLPPTHVETIAELDAKTFPKLAKAIREGKINAVSMGANIETSVCSICENRAQSPKQYCDHIKGKGNEFEVTSADGSKTKKKAYEECYGINFFEQSYVFDPADETALFNGEPSDVELKFSKTADRQRWLETPGGVAGALNRYDDIYNPERPADDLSVGDVIAAYTDGTIVLDDGITTHNAARAAAYFNDQGDQQSLLVLLEKFPNLRPNPYAPEASVKEAAGLKTDVNQPGDEYKTDGIKNQFPGGDKPTTKKPQSESVAAPERVDTLTNDLICPQCESDNLEQDPDEIWRCPTCNYELPPEGFRAPDLEEAREMDIRQKIDSKPNEDGEEETNTDEDVDEGTGDDGVTFTDDKKKKKLGPVAPVQPLSKTINNNNSNRIISEMDWNTKTANVDFVTNYLAHLSETGEEDLDSENIIARSLLRSYGRERLAKAGITRLEIASAIEKFAGHNKTAAVEETTIGFADAGGVHNGTWGQLDRVGIQVRITFHDAPEHIVAGLTQAVNGGMLDNLEFNGNDVTVSNQTKNRGMVSMALGTETAKASGGSVADVPITVEAPDDQMQLALDIIHTGGFDESLGSAPRKQVLKPRRPQSQTKEEKIVSDQLQPKEADRRTIKREESETEEGGVTRTETIVEETGELGGSLNDEPKAEEKEEEKTDTSTESTEDKETETSDTSTSDTSSSEEEKGPWEQTSAVHESKLLLAMEVAKLASSLGVIPVKEELSYAAELESKSEDVIRDRKEVLGALKTSGAINKTARYTTIPQVPRLGQAVGAVQEKISAEDYLADVFL